MRRLCRLLFLLPCWFALPGTAQQQVHLEIESPFGSFVEKEFPFFTQTLDARKFGEDPWEDNLTPRGIIVKLGNGTYGCFDPDLLRWSLLWRENPEGEYLTMDGMAPGSYRLPNRKAPSGQGSLPRPIGTPLAASPAVPGWTSTPDDPTFDPRERGTADEAEVGIGPLPLSMGRFEGIQLSNEGARIHYRIGSSPVTETLHSDGRGITRKLFVEKPGEDFVLVVPSAGSLRSIPLPEKSGTVFEITPDYRIEFHLLSPGRSSSSPTNLPERYWTESVDVSPASSNAAGSGGGFTFDDLSLPVPNRWKRNVRLAGLDFFPDGRAVFCTFDGDVWIVHGIEEGSDTATWSRFASGLHEPKSVSIVDGRIFVSDRNGIVRLEDTDGNGEADWYANFSSVVPQTAETREFAMDMVADGKGGFYLAKGGQVGSTRGRANGTIVHVAPDGDSFEIIATGLRQPYIGLDPETGVLTSSDQQGHWKPATPIYRIQKGNYYGFQPAKLKDKAVHPAPIGPPEIWIPHFINQSGASQVWMTQDDGTPARMASLSEELVHIGYNRPELFRVYLSEDGKQGAVVPILSGFPSGLLKGAIHPVDGRLYVAGFEIWGTSGARISGLFRVRPDGSKSWLPRNITASGRGILISFDHALSEELALEPGRYSVDRWNYQQTHNYGSGNFRPDGKPGQESIAISSIKISKDRRSLFLGIPGMDPCHSLRITYRLPVEGSTLVESAYLTIHELAPLDLTSLGFPDDDVDLRPRKLLTGTSSRVDPTAKLGKEVALRYGCIACHATGEKDAPSPPTVPAAEGARIAVGPPWKGLWKSKRTFTDGSFIKSVDETYLRESILDPERRVAEGFETEKTGVGMPSYLGVLQDHEIDSILLYIKTLR